MVGDNGYWVFSSTKVVLPFFGCLDDSKELPIIDVIIPLGWENIAE